MPAYANPSDDTRKTVLVTGASGNLGQAVVKKFLAEQWNVCGTTHGTTSRAGNQGDKQAVLTPVDLLDENQTGEYVRSVIEQHHRISAAVLTAGGFAAGKMADTTTNDILQQYQLNFITAYNIARPLFLHMLQQNYGRIFLVGSKPGLAAANGKGLIAYSLAKSLIFRLAELMNQEAKDQNVVVSVIVPGTIDTPQNRQAMPDADFSKWASPEAIADIIYVHCTEPLGILREPVVKVYHNS
jgi:NAD(P)-dependent dehydrogenase (short-subunit alcohol dehydrogenase family)